MASVCIQEEALSYISFQEGGAVSVLTFSQWRGGRYRGASPSTQDNNNARHTASLAFPAMFKVTASRVITFALLRVSLPMLGRPQRTSDLYACTNDRIPSYHWRVGFAVNAPSLTGKNRLATTRLILGGSSSRNQLNVAHT